MLISCRRESVLIPVEISDGLRIITRNPSIHDFYLWAFMESTSPDEHRFLSPRTWSILSINYDKKKHSLPSIFIDREE